jgi:DNA-directed RNA polymerase subunit RPC12/RpoP
MSLERDMSVVCPYCGARDVLPPDELGRALEIRSRLALAQQRTAQLRGVDAALASIFEDRKAFLRVCALYVGVALLVFGASVAQTVPAIGAVFERLPRVDAVSILAAQSVGPVFILGIALSLAIALAFGRAQYRSSIRPLLLARLPDRPGLSFGCRACGASLPPSQRPDVRCQYCDVVSLVPRELYGPHAAALCQEAESARQRLKGVNIATMSIAKRMRVVLGGGVVLTIAVACGVMALPRWLAAP